MGEEKQGDSDEAGTSGGQTTSSESVVAEPAPSESVEAEVIGSIKSVKDYMSLVGDLTAQEKPMWFRGTRSFKHDLKPSLYRHPSILDANHLIELEWTLLSDFKHRAPPFAGRLPSEDLDLLFLMQHFGVPTRLLDWSESPFVALFFALENALQLGADAEDATVWVLDPILLNQVAANNREGSDRVYSADASEIDAYKPRPEAKNLKERLPSSLLGIHNSPRIVAQRGTFTIFGKDTTPMNKHPEIVTPSIVRRITIEANRKNAMFKELARLGIADSLIYPDLDGLGREIKNSRGFWS